MPSAESHASPLLLTQAQHDALCQGLKASNASALQGHSSKTGTSFGLKHYAALSTCTKYKLLLHLNSVLLLPHPSMCRRTSSPCGVALASKCRRSTARPFSCSSSPQVAVVLDDLSAGRGLTGLKLLCQLRICAPPRPWTKKTNP